VIWFERLMYLSIAIGPITTALDWNHLVALAQRLGGAGFVLFVDGFTLALLILFVWLVARRAKNWARWVDLGMFVVGTPSAIRLLANKLPDKPLLGTLNLVQVALQIVALVLIFTGNARDWFKRNPATL
jgi:hypothetical protein